MARGWESKSVEDQINERNTQKPAKNKENPQDPQKESKRQGIILARSRTIAAMESARDERYRALMKRTLEHLDAELGKLGDKGV